MRKMGLLGLLAILILPMGCGHAVRSHYSITLQPDVAGFLMGRAGSQADSNFIHVLNQTKTEGSFSFIETFCGKLKTLQTSTPLAHWFFVAANGQLQESDNDAAVIRYLKTAFAKRIFEDQEILKKRLNTLGSVDFETQIDTPTQQIIVRVATKGVDSASLKGLLQNPGGLELYETYRPIDLLPYVAADKDLQKHLQKFTHSEVDLADKDEPNPMEAEKVHDKDTLANERYSPDVTQKQPKLALFKQEDTSKVKSYLQGKIATGSLPTDLRIYFSSQPEKQGYRYGLYLLRSNHSHATLGGDIVEYAKADHDKHSQANVILIQFKPDATQQWAEMTQKNVDRAIAICVDHKVYSCPTVMNPILGGNSQISGDFTKSDARNLANVIQTPPLPVRLAISKFELKD